MPWRSCLQRPSWWHKPGVGQARARAWGRVMNLAVGLAMGLVRFRVVGRDRTIGSPMTFPRPVSFRPRQVLFRAGDPPEIAPYPEALRLR